MPKRSREADVARARAHANNRGAVSVNALTDPAVSQSTKEAAAARLTNALAGAQDNRPHLMLVDELNSDELAANDTSANADVFEQKLDEIFNPPYASQEWIKDVEGLFSEPQTRVHHPAHPKTFLQKMKPIKPGRHAKESTPGRFKKVWLALGSVASSLAVKNSPFSSTTRENLAIIPATKKPLLSRHSKDSSDTRTERAYPERRRSRKYIRAVGAMVATAAVITGALFMTNGENNEPYEGRREAAARSYETPIRQPEVQSENIVGTTPTPENQVMDETQIPKPTEAVATPAFFTITIESGGNIWDATKTELQKSNPDVANQEVARVANSIVWFYDIDNPDRVLAGTSFDVDLEALYSIC